jgi:hypothetical protein
VLACVGDKSAAVKIILAFYKPTGPLSGVTTTAILIWFFAWGISAVALALLGLSLLLTFPPVVDLF